MGTKSWYFAPWARLLGVAVLLGSQIFPGKCNAQGEGSSLAGPNQQQSEAVMIPGEVNVGFAELLGQILPVVGTAYAKDWRRGIVPQTVQVAGFAAVVYFKSHGDEVTESTLGGDPRVWLLGGGLLILGSALGGHAAKRAAQDYNAELRRATNPVRLGIGRGLVVIEFALFRIGVG